MENKGLVSIVMPSYNTASYIGETIESIQNQTYPYWELIIVDDCSKDDTDAVVAPYLKDERIRYLKNEKNSYGYKNHLEVDVKYKRIPVDLMEKTGQPRKIKNSFENETRIWGNAQQTEKSYTQNNRHSCCKSEAWIMQHRIRKNSLLKSMRLCESMPTSI